MSKQFTRLSACIPIYSVLSDQTVPGLQNLQLNGNLVMSHQGLKVRVGGWIELRGYLHLIIHGDVEPYILNA